jgi:hypothetical protein
MRFLHWNIFKKHVRQVRISGIKVYTDNHSIGFTSGSDRCQSDHCRKQPNPSKETEKVQTFGL